MFVSSCQFLTETARHPQLNIQQTNRFHRQKNMRYPATNQRNLNKTAVADLLHANPFRKIQGDDGTLQNTNTSHRCSKATGWSLEATGAPGADGAAGRLKDLLEVGLLEQPKNIWVNSNNLTTTSLEMMVSKWNYPNMVLFHILFQVSE